MIEPLPLAIGPKEVSADEIWSFVVVLVAPFELRSFDDEGSEAMQILEVTPA